MTARARALASGLALLAVVGGVGLWRYAAARPKPVVESRVVSAEAGGPARPSGPTAREALERRTELGLNEAQVARLAALEREWQQTGGPLESEVRQAEGEFQRFMEEAQRAGRGNLAEIQRRAVEHGELLAAYRQSRAAHAGAVRQVLTEGQRARWTAMTAPQQTGAQR